MTLYYRLTNPDITSISVDGIEHKVNPESGLLEIDMMTPGLIHDLEAVRGSTRVEQDAIPALIAERKAAIEAENKAKAEADAKAQGARRPASKESSTG